MGQTNQMTIFKKEKTILPEIRNFKDATSMIISKCYVSIDDGKWRSKKFSNVCPFIKEWRGVSITGSIYYSMKLETTSPSSNKLRTSNLPA